MKRVFIAVASALCLMGAEAVPKDSPKKTFQHTYNGVGTWSCGVYLKNRADDEEETGRLVSQWAAGYFAGFSAAWGRAKMQDMNLANDLETYPYWVDKWCRDDPSSLVGRAIEALLRKQRGS